VNSNAAFYLQLAVTAIGLIYMYRLGWASGYKRGLTSGLMLKIKSITRMEKDKDSE
jgi:hypothetical protein